MLRSVLLLNSVFEGCLTNCLQAPYTKQTSLLSSIYTMLHHCYFGFSQYFLPGLSGFSFQFKASEIILADLPTILLASRGWRGAPVSSGGSGRLTDGLVRPPQ
ncbi:hypothetical protein XENORESO_014426 [Xenotaenia resolanae]|uniref:Uncharacterized protein n=1 Tax=Xenotaenia resolanae TaxID=208358 RepID=A0ABV0WST2_9TELE